MAQKVQVILVDDLDGGEATETVLFALDGVSYEIDLSEANARKLRDDFATWVGNGRRANGRKSPSPRRGGTQPRRERSGRDLQAVRDWGRANGFQVSDRGRVSSELQEAYNNANS